MREFQVDRCLYLLNCSLSMRARRYQHESRILRPLSRTWSKAAEARTFPRPRPSNCFGTTVEKRSSTESDSQAGKKKYPHLKGFNGLNSISKDCANSLLHTDYYNYGVYWASVPVYCLYVVR